MRCIFTKIFNVRLILLIFCFVCVGKISRAQLYYFEVDGTPVGVSVNYVRYLIPELQYGGGMGSGFTFIGYKSLKANSTAHLGVEFFHASLFVKYEFSEKFDITLGPRFVGAFFYEPGVFGAKATANFGGYLEPMFRGGKIKVGPRIEVLKRLNDTFYNILLTPLVFRFYFNRD